MLGAAGAHACSNAHAQRRAPTPPARPSLPAPLLAGIGNYHECFQAQHPCKDCMWHPRCFCAHLPAKSCENKELAVGHSACGGGFALRNAW
eukprot:4605548-Prymnesium_polylepis.1